MSTGDKTYFIYCKVDDNNAMAKLKQDSNFKFLNTREGVAIFILSKPNAINYVHMNFNNNKNVWVSDVLTF